MILDDMITAAIHLAGGAESVDGARVWRSEGGRQCPVGWNNCSQTVYVDLVSGGYDYGEQGGPGWNDCVQFCRYNMRAPAASGEEG